MLINLYFPEIRDLFDRLVEARDKAGGVRMDFKNAYTRVQQSSESARRFGDPLQEFDEVGKLLLLSLAALSSDMIRKPPAFFRVMPWFQKGRKPKPSIPSAK